MYLLTINCIPVNKHYLKVGRKSLSYSVECSLGNGYVLDSYVRPDEHACKGRMKKDFLEFRCEVACGLIVTYRSRGRVGPPHSYEH